MPIWQRSRSTELVDSAHQRGIRILFDVVMNHTGYATLADMQEYQLARYIFLVTR